MLAGSAAANRLAGEGGHDKLLGWSGNDTLDGGAGRDTLSGGDGDDLLIGGLGADDIAGGSGNDTVLYAARDSGVRIDPRWPELNTGEAGGDRLYSVENMIGGAGNDNLRGEIGANELWGEGGDDWLFGRWGDDTLHGGAGNDLLEGGTGRDSFVFTGGQDTISDFASGVDTLLIDTGLTGESLGQILQSARVVDSDLVLSIGAGHSLTLTGIEATGLVEPGLDWLQ